MVPTKHTLDSFKGRLHIGIEHVRIESPIYEGVEWEVFLLYFSIPLFSLICDNRLGFISAVKIPTKKATSMNKDVVKEKDEGNTNKIITTKVHFIYCYYFFLSYILPSCLLIVLRRLLFQASQKPPPTLKKRKQKEPQVQINDSNDSDLSPDTTKPTKKKKKKVKTYDALSHPKIKATKVPAKKTSTPRVPSADPEPQSKRTPEKLESNNSSHGAEVPKVNKNFTLISQVINCFSWFLTHPCLICLFQGVAVRPQSWP